MFSKQHIILIMSSGIALSACGTTTPSCDGPETNKLVIDLITQNTPKALLEAAAEPMRNQMNAEFIRRRDATKLEWDTCLQRADTDHEKETQAIMGTRTAEQCAPPEFFPTREDGSRAGTPPGYDPQCSEKRDAARERYMTAKSQCATTYLPALDALTKEKESKLELLAKQIWQSAKYQIGSIRVTDENKETGARVCAARLLVKIPDVGEAGQEIRYKVERTTDNKIYVTISGL